MYYMLFYTGTQLHIRDGYDNSAFFLLFFFCIHAWNRIRSIQISGKLLCFFVRPLFYGMWF